MRIQQFLLLIALFCISFSVEAQREETVLGSRGLRLSGAWGGQHNMITGMGNSNAYMTGGFGGLEFGKTLFVGFSNYQLVNDVDFDRISDQDFDMDYSGLILGVGVKNYKPVHGMFNLMLGTGDIDYGTTNDKIVVIQPSAGVEFNIFRWFHIGLDGGYRFVADTEAGGQLSDRDVSGAFGQVTFKFGYSWGRKTGWGKNKQSRSDVRIDIQD